MRLPVLFIDHIYLFNNFMEKWAQYTSINTCYIVIFIFIINHKKCHVHLRVTEIANGKILQFFLTVCPDENNYHSNSALVNVYAEKLFFFTIILLTQPHFNTVPGRIKMRKVICNLFKVCAQERHHIERYWEFLNYTMLKNECSSSVYR